MAKLVFTEREKGKGKKRRATRKSSKDRAEGSHECTKDGCEASAGAGNASMSTKDKSKRKKYVLKRTAKEKAAAKSSKGGKGKYDGAYISVKEKLKLEKIQLKKKKDAEKKIAKNKAKLKKKY